MSVIINTKKKQVKVRIQCSASKLIIYLQKKTHVLTLKTQFESQSTITTDDLRRGAFACCIVHRSINAKVNFLSTAMQRTVNKIISTVIVLNITWP